MSLIFLCPYPLKTVLLAPQNSFSSPSIIHSTASHCHLYGSAVKLPWGLRETHELQQINFSMKTHNKPLGHSRNPNCHQWSTGQALCFVSSASLQQSPTARQATPSPQHTVSTAWLTVHLWGFMQPMQLPSWCRCCVPHCLERRTHCSIEGGVPSSILSLSALRVYLSYFKMTLALQQKIKKKHRLFSESFLSLRPMFCSPSSLSCIFFYTVPYWLKVRKASSSKFMPNMNLSNNSQSPQIDFTL